MARIFGTDGVRGRANVAPMDSETVMQLGRAAAHVFGKGEARHRLLIGKDTRLSGYMLETALESGIASMGVDVILVGTLPTPGVAFMTRSMRADAAIMISASHNPYEDNGIKFFGADGFKLPDSVEDEIASYMEPGKLDGFRAAPDKIGKMYRVEDAVGRYAVYLKSCVDKNFKLDGVKIVVDSANGAAYRIARILFSELGAELITIGDTPNGKNINLGCGSTHPELLAEKVIEHGAFCGIAFDGDADRIICCDEKGGIIDGDLILAICATALKKSDSLVGNGVVGTVMTNLGLEKSLEKRGIKLFRADVGDRYVLAEMKKHGLLLGGEQSGHIIFLEHNTTGDALLSALMLLSNVLKEGRPLSEYHSLIERFPQQLINVLVKEKKDVSEVPELEKIIKETEGELEGRGRLLFRYSGTEQKARVMVEADDEQLCQRSAEKVADVVRKSLGQ